MGLYNPVLGNIPQPDKNSSQVSFILPKDNYGAQVVTPQINELFISTLETEGTQTDTETITREIILTGIYLQGLNKTIGGENNIASVDVYINAVKIFSLNLALSGTSELMKEFSYYIPVEHVRIYGNSILKLVSFHERDYTMNVNCTFAGYISTKQ